MNKLPLKPFQHLVWISSAISSEIRLTQKMTNNNRVEHGNFVYPENFINF